MDKKIIYIIVLLLTLSLVQALTITTNKEEYTGNEVVTITPAGCEGNYIILIKTPGSNVVDVIPGLANQPATYNTQSSAVDGKYTIELSCTNSRKQKSFCVDSPGCLREQEPPPSSGGHQCIPSWTCGSWSFCNASLQQSKTCIETRCNRDSKVEVRSCVECAESWVCDGWSVCAAGKQTRTCTDEHHCGTITSKPVLQQSCQMPVTKQPYTQTGQQQQTQTQKPQTQVKQQQTQVQQPTQKFSMKKIWTDYKPYVIAVPSLLIFINLLIFFVLHARKKKTSKAMTYDPIELENWVEAERAEGTSDDDIVEILAGHIGWSKEQVLKSFSHVFPGKAAV